MIDFSKILLIHNKQNTIIVWRNGWKISLKKILIRRGVLLNEYHKEGRSNPQVVMTIERTTPITPHMNAKKYSRTCKSFLIQNNR